MTNPAGALAEEITVTEGRARAHRAMSLLIVCRAALDGAEHRLSKGDDYASLIADVSNILMIAQEHVSDAEVALELAERVRA